MRITVKLPLAPAIIMPVQTAVAAFLASGFVTATMIVETRATSHQRSAAFTPVMLTRGSSVMRHASVFLSRGSVMGTLIVTTVPMSPRMFAKASTAMLVRFSVTINDAFQSTGGAIMNKTVAMGLTNKDASLVRVPARNSGVGLAVVSAVAGCAMVTVTVRTPQTSVTVQMFRAELTGSVATMATVFCRNGSVMVVEIVMMLQTNKVVQLDTVPHKPLLVITRCVFIRCGSAMEMTTVGMEVTKQQSFVRPTAVFTPSFVAETTCASPNGKCVTEFLSVTISLMN